MPCGVHDLQGIFITENISGASVPPIVSDGPASERVEFPKIPPEIDGVQVNFCKNPSCANYGVPPGLKKGAHRSKAAASTPGTEYRLTAKSRGGVGSTTSMQCLLCCESFPLKSNLGIAEEIARLSGYLWDKREPSCPNPACLNHGVGVTAGKHHYSLFGRSEIGSQRYKCQGCAKTFSVGKSTRRQRVPHKNKDIFELLMNKMPFNRICEFKKISMKTLYDKINFIHSQCLAFAADREQKLLKGMPLPKLYISVDRQSYMVNWSEREGRRNVMLHATGSADQNSGYVFGMHLNFDAGLDPKTIEAEALSDAYSGAPPAFRRFSRLWRPNDYAESVTRSGLAKASKSKTQKAHVKGTLEESIAATYVDAGTRDDVEVSEGKTREMALPSRGMQVHAEYTLYGHFFHLKRLLKGAEKIRFFLDQDSGIRAACLAAFQPEISARKADAFYVRIQKDMMAWEKQNAVSESKGHFKAAMEANPSLTEYEVKVSMMKQELERMAPIGVWRDNWATHPLPDSSEALKAMCYLTDFGDYDLDHKARLCLKATLHPIDRFFQQVRRRLSLLERPIGTASKIGRTWYGYSAYRPENIEKVLTIFRVFYNYCLIGKDKKTPAMRLGLARAPIDPQEIIYFV